MNLKPGSRWRSAVDSVEVVIVRPPNGDASLECGGHPMIALGADVPGDLEMSPEHANGTAIGKRYADASSGMELLGSKGGQASLSIDGRPAQLRDAKPLPASD